MKKPIIACRHAAVFLDRDGVLIRNIDGDYVRSVDQISVLPHVQKSLRRLSAAELTLIVVTNQAAVAKRIITLEQALAIQRVVESRIGGGSLSIHSIICPHAVESDCECRKPKPGMLLSAARKYCIDLKRSFLIGDAGADLFAAKAAGVKAIMVLTGRGEHEHSLLTSAELQSVTVQPTILEATDYILNTLKRNYDE